MSDASDSQNRSEERDVELSAGSSPQGSFYEGERSSPELPKAATRARKKKNSDDEDEDFVAKEITSKKKKPSVVSKEYGTQKERGVTRKISASATAKRGISSENPEGSQQAPIQANSKAAGK
jgi:hypothetical protein